MHDVLQLDITGQPQAWIPVEQAAIHVATRSVAWSLGDTPLAVLRGGMNVSVWPTHLERPVGGGQDGVHQTS